MEAIRRYTAIDDLVAVPTPRYGRVAMLVVTPEPGKHVACSSVTVIPGKGFAGDHERKSYYKGRLVPGREVTAVSLEVLQALDIAPLIVGDNLITEGFDLAALEPGDLVAAGAVVLERSPREHRPCTVFRDRTSEEAFRVISQGRNRGALFTVRTGGVLHVGDALSVSSQR